MAINLANAPFKIGEQLEIMLYLMKERKIK